MLRETHSSPNGLSLLQGPPLSGKSALVRTFIESIDSESAVAVVDGTGLNTTKLLLAVLRQFGYEMELSSANELLGLLRIFALQQATANVPPLLIVENIQALNPSALRALCELAELRVRFGSALKVVLTADRPLAPMLRAPAMEAVARRVLHDFHLRPMSSEETRQYLHAKLAAAGAAIPATIFPNEACQEIWRASGGWPGIIDRIALLALARAPRLPVDRKHIEHPALPAGTWQRDTVASAQATPAAPAEPPQLVVTNNGSVIDTLTLDRPRLLIGRSEHNDVAIPSRFISRHHALIVRHAGSTFLMDLNSTNGTFVNASRISNHVLIHDDVITVGHHKIKFYDPFSTQCGTVDSPDFADTAIMKTLEDMRTLLARENTALLPVMSEDLPTIQT
ncbi:MAG TPA: FHA domain-containing protein [Woeseiaceae bacterium]